MGKHLKKDGEQRSPGYPKGTKSQRSEGSFKKSLPKDKDGNIKIPPGYIIDWDAGFELMFNKQSDRTPTIPNKPIREEIHIPKNQGGGFNYTKV